MHRNYPIGMTLGPWAMIGCWVEDAAVGWLVAAALFLGLILQG